MVGGQVDWFEVLFFLLFFIVGCLGRLGARGLKLVGSRNSGRGGGGGGGLDDYLTVYDARKFMEMSHWIEERAFGEGDCLFRRNLFLVFWGLCDGFFWVFEKDASKQERKPIVHFVRISDTYRGR